jgi:hypothetical protein
MICIYYARRFGGRLWRKKKKESVRGRVWVQHASCSPSIAPLISLHHIFTCSVSVSLTRMATTAQKTGMELVPSSSRRRTRASRIQSIITVHPSIRLECCLIFIAPYSKPDNTVNPSSTSGTSKSVAA